MDTIPQDATKTKRELIILSMRGGQDAMQCAIGHLTTQGQAGEAEAAAMMRRAAAYFKAAAVLLDAKPGV